MASALLKKKINYTPTRFNQMLAEHGAVETARRLINSDARHKVSACSGSITASI